MCAYPSLCLSVDSYSRARAGYEAPYEQYCFSGTSERKMKSTKVQNPRRIYTAYQANNALSLATPRGVAVYTTRSVLDVSRASCIRMGKAEPATMSFQNNPPRCAEGEIC